MASESAQADPPDGRGEPLIKYEGPVPIGIHPFEEKVFCIVTLSQLTTSEIKHIQQKFMEYAEMLKSDQNQFTRASRWLVTALRHGGHLERHNPPKRWDGYYELAVLLRNRLESQMRVTPIVFVALVFFKSKGRFEMKIETRRSGQPMILVRATQGHSIPVDPASLYVQKIKPEDVLDLHPIVHGTWRYLEASIKDKGLLPGGELGANQREAVHFMAVGLMKNRNLTLSRTREGADLYICLDLGRFVAQGGSAYLSTNGAVNIFGTVPPNFLYMYYHGADYSPTTCLDWWLSGGRPGVVNPPTRSATEEAATPPPMESPGSA
jgi:RNA:NAD 2'-phosphotransferase (TPT1/KptA family)